MLDRTIRPQDASTRLPRRSEIVARFIRADEVPAFAERIGALAAVSGETNPHALPASLVAAGLRAGEGPVAAIATDGSGAVHGVWPMRIQRVPPGLRVLKAPVDPSFDLVGVPMVIAGGERQVIRAILSAIRARPDLPQQMILRAVPAEGPVWQAFVTEAAIERIAVTPLDRWERGLFNRRHWVTQADYLTATLSASRRKRLRQKAKALAALGDLSDARLTGAADIGRGLEAFLQLEAGGWKGRKGTALAQRPADAAYVRAVMTGLAAGGDAWVETLQLDGRIVAAGLMIRHAGTVWFWKTAYDERLSRHSPGVLLDLALTKRLFEDDSIRQLDTGTDDSVDPASMIWGERRAYLNAVVNLRPEAFVGHLVVAAQQARAGIRSWRVRRLRERARARETAS
jgi:hypothetical protein